MDNTDLNYYSLMDTHEYYYYLEGTLYLVSQLLSTCTMHFYYKKVQVHGVEVAFKNMFSPV